MSMWKLKITHIGVSAALIVVTRLQFRSIAAIVSALSVLVHASPGSDGV